MAKQLITKDEISRGSEEVPIELKIGDLMSQVKLQEEQLHRSLDKLAERRQQLDKSRLDKNDFGITQLGIQFEPKVTPDKVDTEVYFKQSGGRITHQTSGYVTEDARTLASIPYPGPAMGTMK